eukprot:COSAG06_NODE_24814_length_652_cov_0.509946_1_plen_46_part_10
MDDQKGPMLFDVPLCLGNHTTARWVPLDDTVAAAGQGSHPCADPTM